jgi:MOSC domain-containing protein YiiM
VDSRFGEAARALEGEGERTARLAAELSEETAALLLWDDWTVKDVLGHVAAAHQGLLGRMQGRLPASAQGRALAEINAERRQVRRDWPLADVLAEIAESRRSVIAYLRTLTDADWDRPVAMSSYDLPLGRCAWIVSSHEREHRQQIEARLPSAAEARTAAGHVAWLNVSAGGVPKLPIYSGALGALGLAGDRHRGRMHGGPTAALCLFSLEVIEALQREGHPIYPGAIGENVTVSGLDWATLEPGDRLRLGPTLVELTRYTTPCANIAAAFVDGDFSRVHASRHAGQARLYARVIETGEIRVGDPVEHIPAAT